MPSLRFPRVLCTLLCAAMLAVPAGAVAGPTTPETDLPAAPGPTGGTSPGAALDSIPDPTGGTDDPLAAYRAAVPAMMQASGNQGCTQCFIDRYGPATFNKAYAVSADGAYGARWSPLLTVDQVRAGALTNCRRNARYSPAHDCFIFFENDEQVWQPQ